MVLVQAEHEPSAWSQRDSAVGKLQNAMLQQIFIEASLISKIQKWQRTKRRLGAAEAPKREPKEGTLKVRQAGKGNTV